LSQAAQCENRYRALLRDQRPVEVLMVDVDGVVADTVRELAQIVSTVTERHCSYDQLLHYSLEDNWGLDRQRFYDIYRRYIDATEGLRTTGIIEGAGAALRQLAKQYRIVFATARPDDHREATEVWLQRHFGDLQHTVYFTSSSDVVAQWTGGKDRVSKLQLARQIDGLAIIEDNPHELIALSGYITPIPVCFAQPWNNPLLNAKLNEFYRGDWAAIAHHLAIRDQN